VLCARNAERTLARQLDALGAQDFAGTWEVLLVDNGSTDATPELLRAGAAALPRCRVLAEARVGVNYARNHAIEASRGEKVALCDADDEVSSQWLRRMVDALDRFDVVGGALEIDRLNEPRLRHQSHNQTDSLPESLGRPYAVGANLAFKRAVWETIGGFDANFARGSDETDFCLRAQDAGYTIGFDPTAIVHYRLRAGLVRIAQQHFHYGRGEERLLAKRDGRGVADGRLGPRWRSLVHEAARHAVDSPAMVADPGERRACVERTAFLAGRFAELTRRSARAARAARTRSGVGPAPGSPGSSTERRTGAPTTQEVAMSETPSDPAELVDAHEASVLLEVTPDRIQVMVDEGLLVPVEGAGDPRFPRGEVIALRELGG
jgi:Glycosyl transferase family 2